MGKKKGWDELRATQRVGVVLLGVLQFLLLAAALWDLRRRSADEIRGSKRMWAAVAFVNYVGPIAYFLLGRKKQALS